MASVGPTHHVLDWVHLARRIHPVVQTLKGWPDDTAEKRQEGTRLLAVVAEHIRWRLWHGQVQRALDLIGETLEPLATAANDKTSPVAVPAGKVATVLRGLETDVAGHSGIILDDATARRCQQPIATATTQSTVQWLLHRRRNASQQMRWPPRGAHLRLKVRTAVMNGTFTKDHLTAACSPPSGEPNAHTAGLPDPPHSGRSHRRVLPVLWRHPKQDLIATAQCLVPR